MPYLRFQGDYGTGKTRALKVIGQLCYKAITCGGAITVSPIFRIIEKYKGTLIIDECDFKNSDTYEEIIKILNVGYTQGLVVLRTEKIGNKFEVKTYDCFCPKIIATRETWQDKALESRCLTYEMKGRMRTDIPLNICEAEFQAESERLRNMLLLWRFRNYGKKKLNNALIDLGIEDRLNQIMIPLASIIEDKRVLAELSNFMRGYNREIIDSRGQSQECKILELIISFIENSINEISMKMLADEFKLKYGSEYEKEMTPRKAGWIVKEKLKLGRKRISGGFILEAKKSDIERLKLKFGIKDTEATEANQIEQEKGTAIEPD